MIEIEKPRIDCEQLAEDGSYGKFVVEPLERGYGTTLGNSLRRILLSSLPGTAASSIKIAGVQHEFSTIPGVKEDVTEIVLNIKGIIAKLHCDGPKTVYIEAAGEGEVKAGDIHADGEVEILNPDLHIATLMSDARLSMEITMTSGRGYVPAEKNKQHQTSIGVIPVDSIYTPVYKVNYTVENTRVRDLTDYDKLTLEIWTDGTISAVDGTVTIPAGYTSGGTVQISEAEKGKVIPGNIKSGATILGVAGKTSVVDTDDADATAGDILSGKTAYVNGQKITGTTTMPTISLLDGVLSIS